MKCVREVIGAGVADVTKELIEEGAETTVAAIVVAGTLLF